MPTTARVFLGLFPAEALRMEADPYYNIPKADPPSPELFFGDRKHRRPLSIGLDRR